MHGSPAIAVELERVVGAAFAGAVEINDQRIRLGGIITVWDVVEVGQIALFRALLGEFAAQKIGSAHGCEPGNEGQAQGERESDAGD